MHRSAPAGARDSPGPTPAGIAETSLRPDRRRHVRSCPDADPVRM